MTMQQQQHVEQKPLLPALHAQLSSAQALCQAILIMTFSVLIDIDNINTLHLDIYNL